MLGITSTTASDCYHHRIIARTTKSRSGPLVEIYYYVKDGIPAVELLSTLARTAAIYQGKSPEAMPLARCRLVSDNGTMDPILYDTILSTQKHTGSYWLDTSTIPHQPVGCHGRFDSFATASPFVERTPPDSRPITR